MKLITSPYLIEFPAIGRGEIGYIGVAESKGLPFDVKRVFWTYYTPQDITRGRHAHYETQMILLAVSGKITIRTEMLNGEKEIFILDKPNQGLYMPPLCWHTMEYSHTATQMVLASTPYQEEDYIRSYEDFKNTSLQNTGLQRAQ